MVSIVGGVEVGEFAVEGRLDVVEHVVIGGEIGCAMVPGVAGDRLEEFEAAASGEPVFRVLPFIPKKAAIFTERLKADLRNEAFFYQYMIEYNQDVLSSAEKAVNALTGKVLSSDEQLLINAYRATQYKQPQRFRATYDELISTGNIGLIKDQKLRLTAMRTG